MRVDFVSVEKALVAALPSLLDGVRVSTERTSTSPVELVRVSRTGGASDQPTLDEALVTFECWAASSSRASDIAYASRREVQALHNTPVTVGTRTVYLSWLGEAGGPVSFPHPDTNLPRYQHSQTVQVIGDPS